MKRSGWILIAAGIILLALVAGSGCTTNRDGTTPETNAPATTTAPPAGSIADDQVYENPTYGFRLTYPSGWTLREGAGDLIVEFVSPKEGPDDKYQERFFVDVEETTLGIDDYMTQRINGLKQTITYFDQLQLSSIKMDGQPARKFVYVGNRGTQKFRWVELITMQESRVYIFTFLALDGHDQDYIKIREQMFESVELVG